MPAKIITLIKRTNIHVQLGWREFENIVELTQHVNAQDIGSKPNFNYIGSTNFMYSL